MDHMLGRRPACVPLIVPAVLLLAGCITSGFAQSESDDAPPASDRALIVERFAAEKLWSWQRRLNLKDWDITIVVSPAGALKKNTVGNIRWDRDKKTAVIR